MRFIRSIISASASRQLDEHVALSFDVFAAPVEVESHFAHSHIVLGSEFHFNLVEIFVVEVGNRSRVEPHCHRSEIGIVDVHGVHAGKGVEINVRQHQMSHTGLDGALYGFVAVGVEFLEIQMAMSVDHNGYDVG